MNEEVVLERHLRHSPARVFDAWTRIDLLRNWLGCGADMLWDIHEWDVQVGGGLRVSLDYDGVPFIIEGEFITIEPPHRLTYRWGAETVDVTIATTAEGSMLTVRHGGISSREMCGVLTEGWTASFDHLRRTLSPATEEAR